MENENKDLQGGADISEMQEKVRRDVSEKIASAAEEVQDEIDAAAAEEDAALADAGQETADGEENEDTAFDGADEDPSWNDANFAEPVKEPKKVTLTVTNLVLSLVGTAIVGALVLLLCLQIPGWVESVPEGKKVASVDGMTVTDMDMNYYVYAAAMEYFDKNGGTVKTPTEYDWDQVVEDGKTAADIVKENALDTAVGEALLMNAGIKSGMEWNEKEATDSAKMQVQQMESVYGEELVNLNAKAQGLNSTKQYMRKIVQSNLMSAVKTDMEENPDKYYPEDRSVLAQYAPTDKATVKHILIANAETAATGDNAEAQDAAPAEDKRAKAEEVLARAKNGEDFDALIEEYNEDTAEPAGGYTFGPGEMSEAFETASFGLGIDEISDVVETEHGYHIIKRIAGQYELEGYWKANAKVNTKNSVLAKISVKDILSSVEQASTDFQTKYTEYQQNASNKGK